MFKLSSWEGCCLHEQSSWELCTQYAAAQEHELQWIHALLREREGASCSK